MQTSLPKVSVIIPTYQHRDFILRTLDSVFRQTLNDYEIIVVDDGSPDDTESLLAPLAKAGRIRFIRQENQGQSCARNRGLKEARGKYIALLDDDDFWPDDKLEWQVAYLESHPEAGVVGGRLQAIDKADTILWQGAVYQNIAFKSLFTTNPFLSPGQTLIRGDLLKQLGGMNPQIWGADDWDLWFRIAARTKIVMLDRLALSYRLHPGNSSKNVARLLSNCCRTVEIHLPELPAAARRGVRAATYEGIYQALGADLVFEAKTHVRHGRLAAAGRSVMSLRPIGSELFFLSSVRKHFLENLFLGGVKRRVRQTINRFKGTPNPSTKRTD